MAKPRPWMELAYSLTQSPESAETRVARRLPDVLTQGASVLEISRRLGESPETVNPLLDRLAESDVLSREPSGMSAPYSQTLYYIRSDGFEFFRYLTSQRTAR